MKMNAMICIVVNSQSINRHRVREHIKERFSLGKLHLLLTTSGQKIQSHTVFWPDSLQLLSAPGLQHAWAWFCVITRLKASHISFRNNFGQLLQCVCVCIKHNLSKNISWSIIQFFVF